MATQVSEDSMYVVLYCGPEREDGGNRRRVEVRFKRELLMDVTLNDFLRLWRLGTELAEELVRG